MTSITGLIRQGWIAIINFKTILEKLKNLHDGIKLQKFIYVTIPYLEPLERLLVLLVTTDQKWDSSY